MQPKILLKRNFDFDAIEIAFNEETPWELDAEVKEQSDALWLKKLADFKSRGIAAWDGEFYRLDNLAEVESLGKEGPIRLEMSIINYRYVNTYRDFQEHYDAHPESRTNHISVGAVIKTSDNYWLFGLRGATNIHSHNVDLIGGGLQRSELEIKSGHDIYRNLLKELREETGITEEIIKNTTGIGIVHSAVSNVILIAEVELAATRAELVEIFNNRLEDEMRELVFVPDAEIMDYLAAMESYRALIPELLENV